MVWKVKNELDADLFNRDRYTIREVVLDSDLKQLSILWKVIVKFKDLSNLDWKWLRYSGVDMAISL